MALPVSFPRCPRSRQTRLALVLGLVLASAACSSDPTEDKSGAGGGGRGGSASAGRGGGAGQGGGAAQGGGAGNGGTGAAPDAGPSTDCNSVVEQHPVEGALHYPGCSEIEYNSDPPSGGNHYDTWSAFRTYDYPVPNGFLVHDLEHGAVVIWYNCPEGCADEVAQAQAFIDGLPEDPVCSGANQPPRRVTMVPYPALGVRWAASSWGWTLRASCFDARAFGDFYAEHHGNGPEDLCTDGATIAENACQ